MIMKYICIFTIVLFLLIIIIYVAKKNRKKESMILEGDEFEEYCVYILKRNGFTNIKLTPGSHDYGCDIIAEKEGILYGIQCKSYSTPVGISAVQQVYAGKDFYDCMVGVVMTNSTYTLPAKEAAKKLKVLLWDGDVLEKLSNS